VIILFFGSIYGKKEIVSVIMQHPTIKETSVGITKQLGIMFGAMFIQLFGWPSIGNRIVAPKVINFLSPQSGEKILDVGCGGGVFAVHLSSRYGCDVTGIDVNNETIRVAESVLTCLSKSGAGFKLNFEIMDVVNLKYPENFFDKVICLFVLEHIEKDDIAIKNISKVLKKNGTLIIYVPTEERKLLKPDVDRIEHEYTSPGRGHVREGYSVQKIKYLLNDNGLQLCEYTHSQKLLQNICSWIGTKTNPILVFPILYPLAFIGDKLSKNGTAILLKAKKL
jgi:ubiquinone/menaquinone biosynthesis C-methylase UbiE